MSMLDDFFAETPESPHPRLRDWKTRREGAGITASLEVFQPKGEFGEGRPEMYVQFNKDGQPSHLDQVPWEDDLNAGLIRLKVKSIDTVQEAGRFSLGLRAAMRKIEREFGDGYFNAVLADLIRESDLTRYQEIAEVMKYAYANSPHREGGAFDRYSICRDLIAGAISERAKELTGDLGYTREEAKGILTSALARYLDARFSVSSRRRLDML